MHISLFKKWKISGKLVKIPHRPDFSPPPPPQVTVYTISQFIGLRCYMVPRLFVCLFCLFVCLFVWDFPSHSRIFRSYEDVTNYARHSWPSSSEGSLACHSH